MGAPRTINGCLITTKRVFDAAAGEITLLYIADIDEQALADRIRKKVFSELRRTTYHWTPMK